MRAFLHALGVPDLLKLSMLGALLGLMACESPVDAPIGVEAPEVFPSAAAASGSLQSEVARDALLRQVRQATARYHSPLRAEADGYIPADHCVEDPALGGGMGYHWSNPDLIDPVFDLKRPEVMLYAPAPNGELRLVAVEYVVIDVGQDRPHFGDHPFDIGGTPIPVAHWSLHVWLYERNPEGIFEPYNPRITCG